MASYLFWETPLGVFKRMAGSIPAPDMYFIGKTHIAFGNTPARDVIFEWKEQPRLSVVVKRPHAHLDAWKIVNDNAAQLFVNEKSLKIGDTITLTSGQKFRFGSKKKLDLTYSFHLYSKDNPASPSEIKSYLEYRLNIVEAEAEGINGTCAKLSGNLADFQGDPTKTNAFSDCKRPIGAFRLVSGNVPATPICFLDKPLAVFGKAAGCDIKIESGECSSKEASVRQDGLGWKIMNESRVHRHFVNERYFKRGETLIIQSLDRIRFGTTPTFEVTYEFILYSQQCLVPPEDMKVYVEQLLKKLEKEATQLGNVCAQLQLKVKKLNATIKKEEKKVKRTKKIKEELKDGTENETEKVKRSTENVGSNKRIKTELEEEESESVAAQEKEDKVVNTTEAKIKEEPIEDCVVIKKEFLEIVID